MSNEKNPNLDTTRMATVYSQPGETVMVTAVPVHTIIGTSFSDSPAVTVCPACHQSITTRVQRSNGLLTWLICGGLAIFGCILGCCLIPFCIDSCKDTDHFCPNCNHHIYKYKRL
ncbi:lipopolysaccharide-induced tumor necrosis factor-alpha factor homolog [Rhinatrema bivittatum]|uniref:lipopolysaccharide-induced tumor necrosis factor-alpha factor homolog n=1 Tax=Rhinatrema bivittatum TaxID=194408 RepID=UPI00112817A8|nr:lipopolysaccharide-induced tumor necrosis factor-alpha factor homolog [Rhinatrema bivittatum]